jgi:hypothetical protein
MSALLCQSDRPLERQGGATTRHWGGSRNLPFRRAAPHLLQRLTQLRYGIQPVIGRPGESFFAFKVISTLKD